MPAKKLTIPTTAGTHTGRVEEGHLGKSMVVSVGAVVVTGGAGRLLVLVKMKGLA